MGLHSNFIKNTELLFRTYKEKIYKEGSHFLFLTAIRWTVTFAAIKGLSETEGEQAPESHVDHQ